MDLFDNTNLSPNSKKLYLTNLIRLNDNQEFDNLDFLDDVKTILNKIEKLSLNTKKQYLISIVSALKLTNKKKLFTEYTKYMNEIAKMIKDKPKEEQQKTLKNNYITWEEVNEIFNQYYNKLNDFKNKKHFNIQEYNILLKTLILSLYILLPVRRNKDYYQSIITNKKNFDIDENFNYCDLYNKVYIYNNFKTKKIYGQQTVEIPQKLMNILKLYVKHHPLIETKQFEVPFLVEYSGKPINDSPTITKILNNIFDKNISSSMLRHIFITDKFKKEDDEKKQTAKEMGHSVSQQNQYILE